MTFWEVDILGVDILGVDILGVDILGRTHFLHERVIWIIGRLRAKGGSYNHNGVPKIT